MGDVVALTIPKRRRPPRAERTVKLTARVVDGLKPDPSGNDRWLWDAELRGFGMRVFPSGKCAWCVQYRDADGRTRRYALGAYPPLTPGGARTLAQQILGKVAAGENPSVDRRTRRAASRARRADTVAAVAEHYMGHVRRTGKATTVASFDRLVRNVIVPRWGSLPAVDLTRDLLQAYLHAAADTPTQANRVAAIVAAAYKRAGLPSPAVGLERHKERARERFLSEAELSTLGTVLREAEAAGIAPVEVVWAVKLLLLTGCRRGEILALQWADVDLDAGVLRLRDAKTGARTVPLPAAAVALLRSLPRSNAWVIPGARRDQPMGGAAFNAHWRTLRSAAGLPDVHAHDLRHTVGTYAGAADVGATSIRHLLGHATTSAVTDRYVNANVPKLREAADRATAGIVAALEGAGETPKAPTEPTE